MLLIYLIQLFGIICNVLFFLLIQTLFNNFWYNKKVFVTGHTGFKGSWLCIFLKILGAKITGYSLKPKSKPNLYNLAKVSTILEKSIFADIRDYNKLFAEMWYSNYSPFNR